MLQNHQKPAAPSVLLISIDALKPEFVFEQQRLGVNLPNLTKHFLENGLTAPEGMESVFPTFTYPCHQSMITGTCPATHGIVNNGIFDPKGEHLGAWHWFASRKVKTLWEAARGKRLLLCQRGISYFRRGRGRLYRAGILVGRLTPGQPVY